LLKFLPSPSNYNLNKNSVSHGSIIRLKFPLAKYPAINQPAPEDFLPVTEAAK
jgi:hypothetical protein